MNIQNETIRINIDINDRDLRSLQDVISDLNSTLSDMNTSIENVSSALSDLQPSGGIVSGAIGALSFMSGAFGILATDTENFKDVIVHLTSNTFPNFSAGLDGAENNLGSLISTFRETTRSAGGFTTALANKKGALSLLGTSLKLLPFAIAIGGIVSLVNHFRDSEEATDDLGEETETLRERIDYLSESIRQNRQAHQDNLDAIRTHERLTGSMIDRIRELNDEQRFTGENQRLLRIWVDQFNDVMGETILTIDRYTGRLDANSQSMIDNRIFNRELALATEKFDEKSRSLNDALIDQNNTLELMEYANFAQQISDAENAVYHYRDELEQATEAMENSASSNLVLEAALSSANRGYREAQEELALLEEKHSILNDKYETNIETIANLEAQMQESYVHMRNLVADYVDEHGIQYRMLNDTQRDVVNEMLGRWETYRDM